MKFPAYIFPAKNGHKARLQLDELNVSEPLPIYSGPHAGMMFLDAGLAERDERWVPRFGSLIADPANEVQLVELELADTQPPEGIL